MKNEEARGAGRTRRCFLSRGTAAVAGLAAGSCGGPESPVEPRPVRTKPVIILRSGWQTENIGDIAHTPGVLRLLRQHMYEADIILWSNAVDRGVAEMLQRNFPEIRIVSGGTGEQGEPDTAALREAFRTADFLLHGSGPGVVARSHLEAWHRRTAKPYGIVGVTITSRDEADSRAIDPPLRRVLEGAAQVFTRETKSLDNLKQAGIDGPEIGFAPDGAFSLKIENEAAAKDFLKQNKLETKEFIAVVPRLRYTPYHKFRKVNWSEEEIRRRTLVNEKHQEEDHAKLREVITAWVRETGHKALLCPEMTYELDIIDPLLYEPLPADVKKRVVRRKTYWITDEAASVYRRAVAVISFECHSPIIAAVNDTPCIYVHQPEDGIKGQMWKDVGLSNWYFEVEKATGQQITECLMKIHNDYAAAEVTVHEAVIYARRLQTDAMRSVRKAVVG